MNQTLTHRLPAKKVKIEKLKQTKKYKISSKLVRAGYASSLCPEDFISMLTNQSAFWLAVFRKLRNALFLRLSFTVIRRVDHDS